MSKRLRIGFDIDGVIYQWDKTARKMLRDVLPNSPYKGYNLKGWDLHQDSTSWNKIQEHVAPEHWDWLWDEGVKLGLFRHGHLFSGSIEAIRKLSTVGDIVLITHRPKQAINDTLAWLSLQGFPIGGLHILTNGEPKSTVRPYVDFFVDDKPENVTDMASVTMYTYLMRRPWNAHFDWPWVVKDLNQYSEAIGNGHLAFPGL